MKAMRNTHSFAKELESIYFSIGIILDENSQLMVENRISMRMRQLGFENNNQYIDYYYQHKEQEQNIIISLLTTHHTAFFREIDHFHYLEKYGIDHLIKEKEKLINDDTSLKIIKIWCAACSTGEEVYTISMFMKDQLKKREGWKYEIIATDVDEKSVRYAKNGVYDFNKIKSIPLKYIEENWTKGTKNALGYFKANNNIKDPCRFGILNLMNISSEFMRKKFDIIFCRNVFIYFNQSKIESISLNLLKALSSSGLLITGLSEPITKMGLPIEAVGPCIYRHVPQTEENRIFSIIIIDGQQFMLKKLVDIFSNERRFSVTAKGESLQSIESILEKNPPDLLVFGMLSDVEKKHLLHRLKQLPTTALMERHSSIAPDKLGRGLIDEAWALLHQRKISPDFDQHGKINKTINLKIPIMIGASTGGTEAILTVLRGLPAEIPPILIVQHIPENYSKDFAQRLDDQFSFKVKEAENGDQLFPNHLLIAPGNHHMVIKSVGGEDLTKFFVSLNESEKVNGHRPSIDVLFSSAAKKLGKRCRGVILTGMGNDGAGGLLEMKNEGASTIAQNEATCIVFGMPKAAIKLGAADCIKAIDDIAQTLIEMP